MSFLMYIEKALNKHTKRLQYDLLWPTQKRKQNEEKEQ